MKTAQKDLWRIDEILLQLKANVKEHSPLFVESDEEVAWVENQFILSESILAAFRHAYPYFDREITRAALWYEANPHRQKRNHFRFLLNWMNRAHDPQFWKRWRKKRWGRK